MPSVAFRGKRPSISHNNMGYDLLHLVHVYTSVLSVTAIVEAATPPIAVATVVPIGGRVSRGDIAVASGRLVETRIERREMNGILFHSLARAGAPALSPCLETAPND